MSIILFDSILVERKPQPDRMSAAFFCRGCGQVWARVIGGGEGWYSVGSQCPDCHNPNWVAGSFFQGLEWEQQDRMMLKYPALARHEFECVLRYAEKERKV